MTDKKKDNQPSWPFPSKDQPLTPWTPEQQKKYQEEQRGKIPSAPM
jgi:hypothetical protein